MEVVQPIERHWESLLLCVCSRRDHLVLSDDVTVALLQCSRLVSVTVHCPCEKFPRDVAFRQNSLITVCLSCHQVDILRALTLTRENIPWKSSFLILHLSLEGNVTAQFTSALQLF